jgi:hypothetical protein
MLRAMTDVPGHRRAMLDWIIAHGVPLGYGGPVHELAAQDARADLAMSGVDYAASQLGDLAGQSWTEDSADESTTTPGLWADVVAIGVEGHTTWFVDGAHTTLSLSEVIAGVLDAGLRGDAVWKDSVTAEQAEQARARAEEHRVHMERVEAARRSAGFYRKGRLP